MSRPNIVDDREEKLPAWARGVIADLRTRVVHQCEPLIRELAILRPRMDALKNRNEALIELLDCAARGGHKTAQEIVKVIECYGLLATQPHPELTEGEPK